MQKGYKYRKHIGSNSSSHLLWPFKYQLHVKPYWSSDKKWTRSKLILSCHDSINKLQAVCFLPATCSLAPISVMIKARFQGLLGCFDFYQIGGSVLSRQDYCLQSLEWPFFNQKLNNHLSQSVWKLEDAATLMMWNVRSGNTDSRIKNKLNSCMRLILSQCNFLLASNWKQNGWKCHICSKT